MQSWKWGRGKGGSGEPGSLSPRPSRSQRAPGAASARGRKWWPAAPARYKSSYGGGGPWRRGKQQLEAWACAPSGKGRPLHGPGLASRQPWIFAAGELGQVPGRTWGALHLAVSRDRFPCLGANTHTHLDPSHEWCTGSTHSPSLEKAFQKGFNSESRRTEAHLTYLYNPREDGLLWPPNFGGIPLRLESSQGLW